VLVLTRRCDESIVIGGDIVVTLLEIRGNQVRIGVDAPEAESIYRGEVWAKILKQEGESDE
jgi:carbon storage regulator